MKTSAPVSYRPQFRRHQRACAERLSFKVVAFPGLRGDRKYCGDAVRGMIDTEVEMPLLEHFRWRLEESYANEIRDFRAIVAALRGVDAGGDMRGEAHL